MFPQSFFFPHRITEEAKSSLRSHMYMVICHHLSLLCGYHQALIDLTSLSGSLHQSPLGQEPQLSSGLCPQSWCELKYHACLQPCGHLQDRSQTCVRYPACAGPGHYCSQHQTTVFPRRKSLF